MRATAEGRPTVGKKPAKVCVNAEFVIADEYHERQSIATQTPSHQSCEATNRNLIQGRSGQVSQPIMTKPSRSVGLVNQELVQRK